MGECNNAGKAPNENARYCEVCIGNGLDYVYSHAIRIESGEKKREEGSVQHRPVGKPARAIEDLVHLRKVRRRGYQHKSAHPTFGLFSKREYFANEPICELAGVLRTFIPEPEPLGAGKDSGSTLSPEMVTCNPSRSEDPLQSERPRRKEKSAEGVFLFRDRRLLLDARRVGNVTRFVRKCCRPNSAIRITFSGEEWKTRPPTKKLRATPSGATATLYALCTIEQDSEILIGPSYCLRRDRENPRRSPESEGPSGYACPCGDLYACLFYAPCLRPAQKNQSSTRALLDKQLVHSFHGNTASPRVSAQK